MKKRSATVLKRPAAASGCAKVAPTHATVVSKRPGVNWRGRPHPCWGQLTMELKIHILDFLCATDLQDIAMNYYCSGDLVPHAKCLGPSTVPPVLHGYLGQQYFFCSTELPLLDSRSVSQWTGFFRSALDRARIVCEAREQVVVVTFRECEGLLQFTCCEMPPHGLRDEVRYAHLQSWTSIGQVTNNTCTFVPDNMAFCKEIARYFKRSFHCRYVLNAKTFFGPGLPTWGYMDDELRANLTFTPTGRAPRELPHHDWL